MLYNTAVPSNVALAHQAVVVFVIVFVVVVVGYTPISARALVLHTQTVTMK